MNFLVSICDNTYEPLWNVVGFIIRTIWIGVPILLIVLGMIDLGKAVVASKEDEVKKATKAFGRRFLYAVCVFLVVWFVGFVFNIASDVVGTDDKNKPIIQNTDAWTECWKMMFK